MATVIDGVSAAQARFQALVEGAAGRRVMIGLVGEPGVGKSTIAQRLIDVNPDGAVLLPMDGFHLANSALDQLGRRERKGAPDTFDVGGYVSALERARRGEEVYVPAFDRGIDESIAAVIRVAASKPVVVTEGNYLLLPDQGWQRIREVLDEVWYLDLEPGVRRERLVGRHMSFGRSESSARAWERDVDEPNARRISSTRENADVVVRLAPHEP